MPNVGDKDSYGDTWNGSYWVSPTGQVWDSGTQSWIAGSGGGTTGGGMADAIARLQNGNTQTEVFTGPQGYGVYERQPDGTWKFLGGEKPSSGGGGPTQPFGFTISGGRIIRTNSSTGAVEDIGAAPQDAQIFSNAQGAFIFDPATKTATLIPGTAPATTSVTVGGNTVGGVSPDTAATVGASTANTTADIAQRDRALQAQIDNNNKQLDYLYKKAALDENQGNKQDWLAGMGQIANLVGQQASLQAQRAQYAADYAQKQQAMEQQNAVDIADASKNPGDYGKLNILRRAMLQNGSGSALSSAVASGGNAITDASLLPLALLQQAGERMKQGPDLSGFDTANSTLANQQGKYQSFLDSLLKPSTFADGRGVTTAAAPAGTTAPKPVLPMTPEQANAAVLAASQAPGATASSFTIPNGGIALTGQGNVGKSVVGIKDGVIQYAAMGKGDGMMSPMKKMMAAMGKGEADVATVGDNFRGDNSDEEIAAATIGADGKPDLNVMPLHPDQRMAEMAGGDRMGVFMKLVDFLSGNNEDDTSGMPHMALGDSNYWLNNARMTLAQGGADALRGAGLTEYPTPVQAGTPGTPQWLQQLYAGITATGKGINQDAFLQEAGDTTAPGIFTSPYRPRIIGQSAAMGKGAGAMKKLRMAMAC